MMDQSMFGAATVISFFNQTSRGKLDARIKLTEALVVQPKCPVLRHLVFRARDSSAGWLFIRTGTSAAQDAWTAFCSSPEFRNIFEQVHGDSPRSIVYHDNHTANWSPPGEEINSRGRTLFAETMRQIANGEYELERELTVTAARSEAKTKTETQGSSVVSSGLTAESKAAPPTPTTSATPGKTSALKTWWRFLWSFSWLRNDTFAGTAAGQVLTLTVKGIPVRFRWCPPGTYRMGSPENETGRHSDENQVSVTLTQGFWLMETECWQKLLEAVEGSAKQWNSGRGDQYPVYNVSHEDSLAFAAKVMQLLRDSGQLDGNWTVTLPTSAQWEYAARAGSTTRYCYGDDDGRLEEYAWYKDNSGGTNHPVGTKRANAWGLHDMHGSVREWCLDVWENPQSGGTDPMGPKEGSDRVYRGGSWYDSARSCRSAYRHGYSPGYRLSNLGFRLSLVPSRGG